MMTTLGFPTLDGEIDRLLHDVVRPLRARPAVTRRTFTPTVDVLETADALLLRADVPGVRPEDLHVSFDKGVLALSGERREQADEQAATYHKLERQWGSFERRFQLPSEIDPDGIEASYDAGVLTVRLPKRPEAKPRTIEVKVR